LPALGGGSFRGEYYQGANLNADSAKVLLPPPGGQATGLLRPDHLATDFTGGYAMWVQNLGERFQIATRWDFFDPNTDLDHDQFWRVGIGANAFYDGNVRITLAYDLQDTETRSGASYRDLHDNLWTVQFQHRF
jgi:hypothetical protein